MGVSTGDERRVTKIIYKHWEYLTNQDANRKWPKKSEIDKSDIMDWWQYCFIIKVKEKGYICEDAGEKAKEFYGFEKNTYIDNRYSIDAPFLRLYKIDAVIDQFDTVVEEERLVATGEEESEGIKMRQMLFPLGDENGITHILGVITFKIIE